MLSYTELRELTKLPDEDLTRCLASLTLSKYKLLVKVGLPFQGCSRAPSVGLCLAHAMGPAQSLARPGSIATDRVSHVSPPTEQEGSGKGISHSDKFSVNTKFADKMRRIRVRNCILAEMRIHLGGCSTLVVAGRCACHRQPLARQATCCWRRASTLLRSCMHYTALVTWYLAAPPPQVPLPPVDDRKKVQEDVDKVRRGYICLLPVANGVRRRCCCGWQAVGCGASRVQRCSHWPPVGQGWLSQRCSAVSDICPHPSAPLRCRTASTPSRRPLCAS